MKRRLVISGVLLLAVGLAAQSVRPPAVRLPASLARRLDPVIGAVWSAFDTRTALADVRFISQYWRLAGNRGYDTSIDHVRARLDAAGLETVIESYPGSGHAWEYTVGTLAIAREGRPDDIVLSREKERLALCINSFPTPAGGVVATLVDVGDGSRDTDYAGKDVTGAVVIGDADAGQLWRRAVVARGAIGVISTSLPDYLNPDPPGARATPRDQWNILQWSSVPYDEAKRAFGFKATPRAAATLRRALAEGPVKVHVTVASTFSDAPFRTLSAEIPGRTHPDERIVMAAHVQEPGANDNASGVATLSGMAAALESAIRRGRIAPPDRTLTFLFINEISGSTQWLKDHADLVPGVRYMFSMDMTGEDVTKTGGSFLIERYPDPGAVWDRPWDPHTEWGRGNVRADQLKGDLINDLHLAVCERVARRTGWVVRTNPYEGGSDHTVFGNAGVPAVLDWHFTDRYYHTNLDTPDKTSAAEMRNVGVSVAATAWLMASATSADALAVAETVADAGTARVALEAGDQDVAAAWRKWYAEAVRSASRLVVGAPAAGVTERLAALAAPFERSLPESFASESLACGTDETVAAPIDVRWETVALAADGRLYSPCPAGLDPAAHPADHRERRERAVIAAAAESPDARLRRAAAIAYGQVGLAAEAASLTADADPTVRRAAAGALADALTGVAREPASGAAPVIAPADVERARARLEARLAVERDAEAEGVLLESLGRLKYADDAARARAEGLIVAQAVGAPVRVVGALRGLDALVRQNPRRPVAVTTRARVRTLALAVPASPPNAAYAEALDRVRRQAFLVLATMRDTNVATLVAGARDPDWQVRRLVAQRMDANRAELGPSVAALAKDPAFQVRYEMAAVLSRAVTGPGDCASLAGMLSDPAPIVVLRVIDQLPAACGRTDDTRHWLTERARALGTGADWHVPARAVAALARLAPDVARPFVSAARSNAAWQARAAAAEAAGSLGDVEALAALAADRDPNVRTSALAALVKLKAPEVVPAAISALQSDDVQLVRTAAGALAGVAGESRDRALAAVIDALRRFTATGVDTSRDARTALVARAGGLLPAARAGELAPYLADIDPAVRAAAGKASAALGGPSEAPASDVRHRYPYQPPASALSALPAGAAFVMEGGGRVEIEFLREDAPVTAARFVELARAGYYDGLTFHRIVPNFVVQGGSPHANEYSSAVPRFMRDEPGAPSHLRGAVGISTRGRDTGDGQVFIDLVDVPRLDHDYTVFARVTAGMDLVDRFLEGARIERVVVR